MNGGTSATGRAARHGAARRRREDKRRRRTVLAGQASAIKRRLAGAVEPNDGGPLLGRHRPVYELADRTRATARGGMGLMGLVAEQAGVAEGDQLEAEPAGVAPALLRV